MADWMAKGNQRKVRKKDKGKGAKSFGRRRKIGGGGCGIRETRKEKNKWGGGGAQYKILREGSVPWV